MTEHAYTKKELAEGFEIVDADVDPEEQQIHEDNAELMGHDFFLDESRNNPGKMGIKRHDNAGRN